MKHPPIVNRRVSHFTLTQEVRPQTHKWTAVKTNNNDYPHKRAVGTHSSTSADR
jgi:hypothetical protein